MLGIQAITKQFANPLDPKNHTALLYGELRQLHRSKGLEIIFERFFHWSKMTPLKKNMEIIG